jgi:hypothetical protein
MLWLIFVFGRLDWFEFQRFVSAGSRRKSTADFGGNDAPSIVLVLLHGVAKFDDLFCQLRLACHKSVAGTAQRRTFQDPVTGNKLTISSVQTVVFALSFVQ